MQFNQTNNNQGDVNNAIGHQGGVVQSVGDRSQARIEKPTKNVWLALWEKLASLWKPKT